MNAHDEIPGFDDAVISLFRLARQHQEDVLAAGNRVWQRAKTKIQDTQKGKRSRVKRQLDRLDEARLVALGNGADPHDPEVAAFAEVFREYQDQSGDLDEVAAVDAFADAMARRYRSGQEERGEQASSVDELRARQRQEILETDDATARPAFVLSNELRQFNHEPEDKIRTKADWWEIGVLVLTVQWPDEPAEDLGIEALLPWGGWNQKGGDIFGHRDGMREYVFQTATCEGEQRAEEEAEYRRLVVRTAKYLGVHYQAAKPEGEVLSVRLDSDHLVRIQRSVAGRVVDSAEIRGRSLVRLFKIVQASAGGYLSWADLEREWMLAADWKGQLIKTETLRDYGRRIRRILTDQGFGRYWRYSADEVAWMPAGIELDS